MKKIFALFFLCLTLACLAASCDTHEHEFGEWMTAKASTCTEEGVEERYCYCLKKETRPAPLDEHTPAEQTNCLVPQYCSVCNTKIANTASHKYGDWVTVKQETCTDDGWKEHTCTACGKTEKQTLPRTGHQYSDWTVVREATCTWPGLREKYCGCGITTSETITVDHTGDWTVLKEPTKTEDGAREKNCESCHETITEILYAFGSDGLTYEKDPFKNTCTVTGIGTCTETDVVIPKIFDGYTVTAIADGAFAGCLSMTSLTVPETVEKIGKSIVSGANNLHTLYYNTDFLCSSENFQIATVKKVVFGGNKISFISESVEEIVISENITVIPSRAFSGFAKLKSIVIPDSITKIEKSAFANCESLIHIEIPASVKIIDEEAFSSCSSLKTVTLNEGLTKIGRSAFSGCTALITLDIPDSVTEIESHAFYECTSLRSVALPKGLTSIEISLFANCTALTDISLPEGLTLIANSAFSDCTSLASIVLPETLTVIQSMAFFSCSSLTNIAIPEKVTALNSHVFAHCDSLTSVTLHNKITYISSMVFTDSAALININFLGTMQEWEAISRKINPDQWGADILAITCTDGTVTIR